MITVESFYKDLAKEKQTMIEELAVLNDKRDQLRDDINRINIILKSIEIDAKLSEQNNGKENK